MAEFDRTKARFGSSGSSRSSPGVGGRAITIDADPVELSVYTLITVFAPNSITDPVIVFEPEQNGDGDTITQRLPVDSFVILPWSVRTVMGTNGGTSAGLLINTIEPTGYES